jgi:hypothetical protein
MRRRPFEGLTEIQAYMAIMRGRLPVFPSQLWDDLGNYTLELQSICEGCWNLEPNSRLNAEGVQFRLQNLLQAGSTSPRMVYKVGKANKI